MTPSVRRLALCVLLAGPLVAHAGSLLEFLRGRPDLEVITNTDVTAAGRLAPAPSKEKPQYYIAVSGGYQDFGGIMGGIKEPPPKEVQKLLTAELARRGYLPATETSPPPTLALFFTWGTLNVDYGFGDSDFSSLPQNRAQILRFLGGNKVGLDDSALDPLTAPVTGLTMLSADSQDLFELTSEDLYVTIVSAYDLESLRQKKRQLLWMTRIASVSRGFDLAEALPAMVAIGGAQFGRETTKPVWTRASERFQPNVKIGELQLVEYLNGAQPPIIDASAAAKQKATAKPAADQPAAPKK
jgi:hypothetical protein